MKVWIVHLARTGGGFMRGFFSRGQEFRAPFRPFSGEPTTAVPAGPRTTNRFSHLQPVEISDPDSRSAAGPQRTIYFPAHHSPDGGGSKVWRALDPGPVGNEKEVGADKRKLFLSQAIAASIGTSGELAIGRCQTMNARSQAIRLRPRRVAFAIGKSSAVSAAAL